MKNREEHGQKDAKGEKRKPSMEMQKGLVK